MLDRILKIMDYNKFTPSEFADALEIDRSRLSHILNGRNKPSLEIVTKILEKFPEINSDWLLLGFGDMLKNKDNFSNNENINSKNEKSKPTTAELDLEIPEIINYDKNISQQLKEDKKLIDEVKNIPITSSSDETAETNFYAETPNIAASNNIQKENASHKEIISIVWFYSDGTYKSFSPEK
jgi:transcriptional regulator with XRE-family HTH domain